MTRDSDVDLLIVEPDTSDQRAEYTRIMKALRDLQSIVSQMWYTPVSPDYPSICSIPYLRGSILRPDSIRASAKAPLA